MKILILSSAPKNFSCTRLKEEALKRNHVIKVIHYAHCDLKLHDEKTDVFYKGKSLKKYDAIIPRIGEASLNYGIATVRHFESMKKLCLNGSLAISRAKDKFRSLQILNRKGIPIPNTFFSNSTIDSKVLVEQVGGPPFVIKMLEGLQGVGVVLAENQNAAQSVIDAFSHLKTNVILQEFIGESNGEDKRVIVLGGKIIAAMKRKAQEGEFRANLHQGGKALQTDLSKQERAMALAAAKELKLGLAGVDLIESAKGPKVIEVNSSPGLQGIETITGINVAGQIIDYIEEKFEKSKLHVQDM